MTISEPQSSARESLSEALQAMASALARVGLRPNALTWFSLAPSVASGVAAAAGWFWLSAAMMALSGLCDLLDGPLARGSGRASRFGALLDSTFDRFGDAAPLLGLVYFYAGWPIPALTCGLAVFAGYSVSYVRARAEGLHIPLPRLWMRRAERMAIVGAGLLLGPLSAPGVEMPAPLAFLAACVVAALSFLATGHAILEAARATRDDP